MNLRRVRSRSGIAARRVAVRTHVPWYWRASVIIGTVAISFALAALVYDVGRRFIGHDREGQATAEVEALRLRVAELEVELQRLRVQSDPGEDTRLTIERTAREQLTLQVRALAQENTRLKEELAVFDNLATNSGSDTGLSINRLRIEQDAVPGQFRYSMLIAFQGGKKDREFKGSLQLIVNMNHDGRDAMLTFPSAHEKDRQRFDISFKHFRRVDGLFQVPDGARVQSVEIRLLQDGVAKATRTAVL